MSNTDSTAIMGNERRRDAAPVERDSDAEGTGRPLMPVARGTGGFFEQHKPEQGKATRVSSFTAALALIIWGMYYLWQRLDVYEGDESWRLLITVGIPIAFAAVLGSVAWWVVFGRRDVGDFMIATEGEMKKVNWSSRGEIIGSTKVVIVFTFLMAILIFFIDIAFQAFMTFIGVLKP